MIYKKYYKSEINAISVIISQEPVSQRDYIINVRPSRKASWENAVNDGRFIDIRIRKIFILLFLLQNISE